MARMANNNMGLWTYASPYEGPFLKLFGQNWLTELQASIFKSNDLQDVHWNQLETTAPRRVGLQRWTVEGFDRWHFQLVTSWIRETWAPEKFSWVFVVLFHAKGINTLLRVYPNMLMAMDNFFAATKGRQVELESCARDPQEVPTWYD